jgi:Phosphoribosyl transferase/TRSP domain C terminus to PRTase_2
MKKSQTSTLSKKKYSYTILDAINVDIDVTENPYLLPLEELLVMAARINKKRSFLFVSKVLGKHLPINPQKGLLTAALLGARFVESVKGMECDIKESLITAFSRKEPSFHSSSFITKKVNPLIIGFAETATALGHAFFDCFESAEYFHTTREEMTDIEPSITFEEEHSHATSHRCYIPLDMINNDREIILVDDEMTSGKTALNIIQSIHSKFPRIEYTVVSILDWRSPENKNQFEQLEKALGITINIVSLIAGKVQVNQFKPINDLIEDLEDQKPMQSSIEKIPLSSFFEMTAHSEQRNPIPFIIETGRFGIESMGNKSLHQKISEVGAFLQHFRRGENTLCLGTGEFMYIPMKIASELGSNVFYQSTTRSPIYIQNLEGYGARYGVSFPNPEDNQVSHFVYNIPPSYYDELFVFFEREVNEINLQPLLIELEKLQIKSIKIVFFSQR